jgi:DNA-directed RNA polymerase subunit L
MKIEVLEDEDSKLRMRIHTSLTLVNLLNDKIWSQKVDVSAYKMEHPYLSKPLLMVRAKNPKKAVLDAATAIIEDVKDFRKQFAAAAK